MGDREEVGDVVLEGLCRGRVLSVPGINVVSDSCGLRLYFEKVLALPKPVSPALHFGRAVHAALQDYNLARWRGGDTSEAAVVIAFATAYAKPESVVDWGDTDAEELRGKGEALVRAFLVACVHPDEKQMGVEVSVHAEIAGLALPLTEALKGNLPLLPKRTQALHGLMDAHVGLVGRN